MDDKQQEAQAAMEALARRRLQNRIAQRNRRKRHMELKQRRHDESKRRSEKPQQQQLEQDEQRTSSSGENFCARCRGAITRSTHNLNTPVVAQPESIRMASVPLGPQASPYHLDFVANQSSEIVEPRDVMFASHGFSNSMPHPSLGFMNSYHDAGEAFPNILLDPELELATSQFSASSLMSPPLRSAPSPIITKQSEASPEPSTRIPPQGRRNPPPAHTINHPPNHTAPARPSLTSPPTPSPTLSPTSQWPRSHRTVQTDPRRDMSIPANRGKTPLHISAERGSLRIVQFLLDHGVDVDVPDGRGRTALHHAARGSHAEVVALLLARGADPEARDLEGRSPLHAAVDAECEAVVGLLTREGADLNVAIGSSGCPSMSVSCRSGSGSGSGDEGGMGEEQPEMSACDM